MGRSREHEYESPCLQPFFITSEVIAASSIRWIVQVYCKCCGDHTTQTVMALGQFIKPHGSVHFAQIR
jgi:hypothetical protein